MGYVKLVENTYPKPKDVLNVIEYLCSAIKCGSLIYGGLNLIGTVYEPYSITSQFLAVQYLRPCHRRLYHLIVSFGPEDEPDLNFVNEVGNIIVNMYPDYQSIFTIHEDTKNLHLHILFNNCPVEADKPVLSHIINKFSIGTVFNKEINCHLGLPVSLF